MSPSKHPSPHKYGLHFYATTFHFHSSSSVFLPSTFSVRPFSFSLSRLPPAFQSLFRSSSSRQLQISLISLFISSFQTSFSSTSSRQGVSSNSPASGSDWAHLFCTYKPGASRSNTPPGIEPILGFRLAGSMYRFLVNGIVSNVVSMSWLTLDLQLSMWHPLMIKNLSSSGKVFIVFFYYFNLFYKINHFVIMISNIIEKFLYIYYSYIFDM